MGQAYIDYLKELKDNNYYDTYGNKHLVVEVPGKGFFDAFMMGDTEHNPGIGVEFKAFAESDGELSDPSIVFECPTELDEYGERDPLRMFIWNEVNRESYNDEITFSPYTPDGPISAGYISNVDDADNKELEITVPGAGKFTAFRIGYENYQQQGVAIRYSPEARDDRETDLMISFGMDTEGQIKAYVTQTKAIEFELPHKLVKPSVEITDLRYVSTESFSGDDGRKLYIHNFTANINGKAQDLTYTRRYLNDIWIGYSIGNSESPNINLLMSVGEMSDLKKRLNEEATIGQYEQKARSARSLQDLKVVFYEFMEDADTTPEMRKRFSDAFYKKQEELEAPKDARSDDDPSL